MIRITHKDQTPYGILLGALLPILVLPCVYLLFLLLSLLPFIGALTTLNSLILLSFVPNFFLLRHFFTRLRFEHAGKGVLIVSVLYILLFFLLIHQRPLFELPGLKGL
ncbi:MAG TPA: hypothetical protein P5531_11550 [Bacteroidales bacterium]|nr:hypothetical protein [Bacteroidales bacterium]HSA44199.1 hypothetical protein [Bacteroidales bacterium]